jgi:CRP-like cAMP-binding protein
MEAMPLDLDPVAPGPGAAASPFAPRPDVVAVFDRDPDLVEGVDPATADQLRRRAWAARLVLDPGPWRPGPELAGQPGDLGLLVVDGLLTRTTELDGRQCPELVGAGDLLRPWDGERASSIELATHWRVLQRTTLAVLDARFAAVACRYPPVVAALLGRAVLRSRALSVHLAIAHVRQAEPRLLVLLWHVADRWGRVTPDGVHVPVALTHELLAHLACLRRPTASTALTRLARAGEVARRRDGTWVLTGEPPTVGGRLARLCAAA